jgi:predicted site-specific integrase-resolvase
MQENLMSISEAARRAGLSAERIRQLCRAGQLQCIQTPLGRLVLADALERFLAERARRNDASTDTERSG